MKQNDEVIILLEALKYFYPGYFGEEVRPAKSFFEYKGQKYSKNWILSETFRISKVPEKTSDIGIAIRELEKIAGSKIVETPESPVQANRPSKDTLEQLEKENQRKKSQRKAAIKKSNQDISDAIKRKQEIYAEQIQGAKELEQKLEGQKIYIKEVENKQPDLEKQAKANPKKFIEDTIKQFESNQNLKKMPRVEAAIIAKQIAITTYDTLTGNSPLVQASIINHIVSNPTLLNKLAPNPKDQNTLKDFVSNLTNQKITQYELSKQLINLTKIDGYENINDVKFVFSYAPKPGFKEFNINDQIVSPSIENLNQQNFLLDNLSSFGEGEIKSRILLSIGDKLTSYISTLPTDSLLAQAYNSEIVQLGLSSLGIVEGTSWVAVEGSFIGRIAIGSGFGPVAGFVQGATGINLGVQVAATTAAEAGVATAGAVGTEVAVTAATGAAAGTVGAAAGTAAGTTAAATGAGVGATVGAAGGPLAIITVPVMALLGTVFGKIVEKIPWGKIKKAVPIVLGTLAALVTFRFVGVWGALAIGAGTAVVPVFLAGGLRGLTLSGAVMTGWGVLGAVVKGVFGVVGIPTLVIFTVFPLLVALILFIINSGAYVVPPWGGERGSTPPIGGGLVSSCKQSSETGPDITEQLANSIRNGRVVLLPETVWGRRDGICITPTMIVMHWSGGTNDNPNGNDRTYGTLVARGLSCQLGVDTDDVWLMEKFFEKQVEFPACASEWNTFSISNEMAGRYFTANPPPPNLEELELTYNVTCKVMKQYNIPWSQIYGHYQVPSARTSKTDPGKDFLEKVFIPEIKKRCPNGN